MAIAGRQGTSGTTLGAFGASGNLLNIPFAAVADSLGNYIYVADNGNHRIIKIARATLISSFVAGTGVTGGDNGAGSVATFNQPVGLAVFNSDSSLLVSTYAGHDLRRIDNIAASATVTTVAGLYGTSGSADGYYPSKLLTFGYLQYI
jgi:DNA-binding beta-propeller fold protein YncE